MIVVLLYWLLKDSGIFWKSIYDLAAVFFGSKAFMYIISMLYCEILTICL